VVLLPAAGATPQPVRPLGQDGRALWDRVWDAARHWVSPDSDLELLQVVCEQVDERQALRFRVLQATQPNMPSGEGSEDRKALRELDRQIVSGLSLLGFTPTDRARFALAEVRIGESKLKDLRERRDRAHGG
jgi:hypothetical protein